MKRVPIIIPGFKGGYSTSLFDDVAKQTYQTSKDLDPYAFPNILRPHLARLDSVTLPTITGGSSIRVYNSYLASNQKYYFIGDAVISSVQNVVLWSTSSLVASPTYAAEYNTTASTVCTELEEFKDGLFFSHGNNLDRWGNLSGTPSRSNISSGLTGTASIIRAHNELGLLFFVHNTRRTIGRYDGSVVTLNALTLNQDDQIVSLDPYGKFMIIGVADFNGSKPSRFIIWDGGGIFIDDKIDLGDLGLKAAKLVNGEIRALCVTAGTPESSIRLYAFQPGEKPKMVKELKFVVSSGSAGIGCVGSIGDLFLFAPLGATYTGLDMAVYSYGSYDPTLPPLFAPYRLVHTGATTSVEIISFKVFGDKSVMCWHSGSTYYIAATGINQTATANGVYDSNAIRLDLFNKGKIKWLKILHKPLPASVQFSVYLKQYGNYPAGTSVPSEDSFTLLKQQSTQNATFLLIEDDAVNMDYCDAFQLRITYDTISQTNVPEIIFPIVGEAEISDQQ